jgi:hypothetical protein
MCMRCARKKREDLRIGSRHYRSRSCSGSRGNCKINWHKSGVS